MKDSEKCIYILVLMINPDRRKNVLLVRFVHFKDFWKAIIDDSCNIVTGPKKSLMKRYPLLIWQCIKKTTGEWLYTITKID